MPCWASNRFQNTQMGDMLDLKRKQAMVAATQSLWIFCTGLTQGWVK